MIIYTDLLLRLFLHRPLGIQGCFGLKECSAVLPIAEFVHKTAHQHCRQKQDQIGNDLLREDGEHNVLT